MPLVTSLPQQSDLAKRQTYLNKMRQRYAYQYSYNNTFPTTIKLPDMEKADCIYYGTLFKHLGNLIPRLPHIIGVQIKHVLKTPIKSFDDYLFFGRKSFSDLRFLDNFLSDEYFGLQRAIGINHVALQKASETNPIPENLALDRIKQVFSQVIENTTFEDALKQQRLYFVDYAMLQGLVDNPSEYQGRQQYVTAPIILLHSQTNGALKPVAIQLNQKPSKDNPVFMPLDQAWTVAKLYAQVADVNYQEFVSHATRIHYLVESFVIATHRELYKQHPVYLLLKPHLMYTLHVNSHHLFLKNKKGVRGDFGAQLGGSYEAMVELMSEAFKTYDFAEQALPVDIAKRGVDDEQLFYPYAQEGKQIWEMIQGFVLEYLKLYYPDNNTLIADIEIQAWARVMASDNGMRVKNFPNQFETIEQLAQAVGQIIFITTAHHSTVHYPQYLFSGFTPAMPFAAYAPAPTRIDQTYSQQDILNALPLRQPSMMQAFIFYLTDSRLGHLGEYKKIEDKAKPLVKKFQQQLAELSQQLDAAEIDRVYPYTFLNPKYITSSVMV